LYRRKKAGLKGGSAVKELYVGNLRYDITLEEVTALFAPYGPIYNGRIIAEREPGHPHAYAFIEMEEDAADTAIQALDGTDFMTLTLRVEESRPDIDLPATL
jgi:RNA recognition motif-containing protein